MYLRFSVLLLLLIGSSFSLHAAEKTIEELDANFKAATVDNQTVNYYDVLQKPFALDGYAWPNPQKPFYRLPSQFTAGEINESALYLANHTSGVLVKFRTNSPYIYLRSNLEYSLDMDHMPRSGTSGFDVYRQLSGQPISHHNIVPVGHGEKHINKLIANNNEPQLQEWTIYLPLYGGVKDIQIGLAPGSQLEAPLPYDYTKPVVFYGSSITQGGCASRGGMNYTAQLCRKLNAPMINLGFSGSALGETAMAEAIAKLDMSVFVMDYDYNAPNAEHLKATHEKFFNIIRQSQPELPIILITKPNFSDEYDAIRRSVIRQTYDNAVAKGDRQVFFIDGETLLAPEDQDSCLVDGVHPNDLGFYRMYQRILPVLTQALEQSNCKRQQ